MRRNSLWRTPNMHECMNELKKNTLKLHNSRERTSFKCSEYEISVTKLTWTASLHFGPFRFCPHSRCYVQVKDMLGDSLSTSTGELAIHPGHHLFDILPSGRQFMSTETRPTRLLNSFFSEAIQSVNKQ